MERLISVEDYKNLIEVASAWIACIDFSDPLPRNLPPAQFAERLWSAPGRCREASALLTRARGHQSSGALLGKELKEVFPPHTGFKDLFAAWVEQGCARTPLVATVRDFENKSLTVQAVIYPTFVADALERIWVICRDITASERARESLEMAEMHYRSLVERPGLVLIRVDAAGYYTYASPCVKEMLGLPALDLRLLPTIIAERIHPNDASTFDALTRAVANRTSATVEVEYRVRQQDGTYHWYFSRLTPKINAAGQTEYYDILALDIEQQKQVELERRHSQRLEILGSLAAGVAHDLNNHLTAMLGALGSAQEELRFVGAASANQQLAAAEQAALGCAEMTKRLLTFGRRNSGELVAVDLVKIAREALLLARHVLPPTITASVSADPREAFVRANSTQLHQVIMNLVTNARDAMPRGGQIDVCVAAGCDQDGESQVSLVVSDTGMGMSADTLHRIFEPFFTTKVPGKGTGLGLSLVQAIVRELGGTVEVRSTGGVGTTFKVTLPSCAGPVAVETRAVVLPPKTTGGHILIADDDDLVRGMLVSVLTRFGFEVTAACDGGEALDIYPKISNTITCAIVDDTMPRLSGIALAQRLKSKAPTLPIILSSGNHIAADKVMSGVMLLPKPYTLDTLLRAVRSFHPIEADGEASPSVVELSSKSLPSAL